MGAPQSGADLNSKMADGNTLVNDGSESNAQNIKRSGTVCYRDINLFLLRNLSGTTSSTILMGIPMRAGQRGHAERAACCPECTQTALHCPEHTRCAGCSHHGGRLSRQPEYGVTLVLASSGHIVRMSPARRFDGLVTNYVMTTEVVSSRHLHSAITVG